MRLRNIPRAESVLAASPRVLKDPEQFRGAFRQTVFQNTNPLHIEIGMGKGQFLLTLALQNPSVNYIGIERYSSVLLRPVEKLASMQAAGEAVPSNLRFICMDAADISQVFAPGEVDRIYLNFSDPWPKDRHAKRRLTSHEFLERYEKILPEEGLVEFKTDNRDLFEFSLEEIRNAPNWTLNAYTYDLHNNEEMNRGNVMTEYEEKFSSVGNPICKLIAEFRK